MNTGKELENLVKIVEKICLPIGFDIKTRERIIDDSGNQIAELDIVISGKVGTTDFKWLIECRDRPSQGAAPASWIEQLVGRRDRFQFNNVTAVSTTGFSNGAVEYANDSGIELRSVREITPEDILDWFRVQRLYVIHRFGDLKDARIFLKSANDYQIKEVEKLLERSKKMRTYSYIHHQVRPIV